jgi:transcriptional regulator GlxA family with amidase domain
LIRVRVRRAQELLATTEIPLTAVADMAGFSHQEYLGVVFKAQVGETPARFRRRAQGRQ